MTYLVTVVKTYTMNAANERDAIKGARQLEREGVPGETLDIQAEPLIKGGDGTKRC